MAWFLRRHLEAALLIEHGAAARWYQAGSWALSCGVRWIVARLVLCFLATLTILLILWFIISAHLPLAGGAQLCRKAFILAEWHVSGGAAASIMRSVTIAHAGRVPEKSR